MNNDAMVGKVMVAAAATDEAESTRTLPKLNIQRTQSRLIQRWTPCVMHSQMI